MKNDLQQNQLHQPHDRSYKFMLSSKRIFVELIRSFIDREWVQSVDEESVQLIPQTFIMDDFRRKESDLVYQVSFNNKTVVFYLLLELQSRVDYRMPYRLLLYQTALWQYLLRDQDEGKLNRKTFQLPPIVPIVLYNGRSKWTVSRRFRHMLTNEAAFGTELLDFEYFLIDVARYTEEELFSLSNAIGTMFLLDQTNDQEQLLNRLSKLMSTIQQLSPTKQTDLMKWIVNILQRKLPSSKVQVEELIQTMNEEVQNMGLEQVLDDIERKGRRKGLLEGMQKGIEKGMEKGIQEGIQEGIEKGKLAGLREAKAQIARQMLAENLDPAIIIRVVGLSMEELNQLREQQ